MIGIPGGSEGSWVAPGPAPGSVPRDRRVVGRGRARPIPGQAAARAKPINRNAKRLLVYVLDVAATQSHNQVVIDLARRQRKPTGEWGPLRPWWYAPRAAHVKYDPEDRLLLALLDEAHHGTSSYGASTGGSAGNGTAPTTSSTASPARAASDLRGIRRFVLRKDQAGLVERLAKTGRLRLRRTEGEDDPPTMRWDDGQPWRFCLDIRTEAGGKRWAWRGVAAPGRQPDGPGRAPGPLARASCPGRRPRRAVRRRGRHAVDPPAPLREGDHLRRAPAGPDARPDPGRDTRSARWSSSSRSASRRSSPGPAPA